MVEMKKETLRRVRNIKKIFKKDAYLIDMWETGFFRLLWFDDPNSYKPTKYVYGHVKLP